MTKRAFYIMNAYRISLYLDNSREIYCRFTEPLERQIAKRIQKGQPVELEHLCNSSTCKAATRAARAMVLKFDGISCSMNEDKAARLKYAAQIIENAKYIASC